MFLLESMQAVLSHLRENQLTIYLAAICMAILQHQNTAFVFLFAFRYLRLLVHIIAFWLYRPAPIRQFGYVTEQDVSVIIPTIEPDNPDFTECLASVVENNPAAIHIVTVGQSRLRLTKKIIAPFRIIYPDISFKVYDTSVANKRQQVAHALTKVRTKICVLVDDHVFWPSRHFLRTAIAPFEDPKVGAVGTNKRVRRANTPFGFASFWNVMGALYLERHNFEIRATNAIDGGVFVISGRTCAYRTAIFQDPDFLKGYLNERFFFGKFGPLNADDDNYITRQVVSKGWKIKIQYTQDSMIETTLGVSGHRKFLSQCLRWVRTTWRSNSASLFTDRTVWRAQPWCVYAVYLTTFVNFALFYDAALVYTLLRTDFSSPIALKALGTWIFLSKMVKITPYFLRHPKDLVYLPGYFAFAYFHSLIKLYAGLTFWVTAWGGRDLDKINQTAEQDGDIWDDYSSSSSDSDSDFDPDAWGRPRGSRRPDNDDEFWDTWTSGSSVRISNSGQGRGNGISTPWGRVRPDSKHMPANVLLDQRPLVAGPRQRCWEDTTKQSHGDVDELLQQSYAPITPESSEQGEVSPRASWINEFYQQYWPVRRSSDSLRHVRTPTPVPSFKVEPIRVESQSPLTHTPLQLPTPEPSVKVEPVSPTAATCNAIGTHGHQYGLSMRETPAVEFSRNERYYNAYCRDWSRATCGRLHYEGKHIHSGECGVANERFEYW
ncbi:hypothetical protein LTR10_020702 [Elasticomyces elasticus]|uniref:Glycosyltransferase 2-like domain-containing protein n=1 Tax=Exophiala sideris TaxID=1016849 RepID=A0ABR0JHA5_9EURO|nr:hypothetical protein LTR10_020702 [Elasticomyces elasticus]KAK5033551.1 hypothetical protein LTS07_003856 [Exophiala sideris]KAK5041954.1 hypothetical protein LTR13_001759 [Exophiala sideris]KAK5064095.1 hypothetical protein LTR69_003864 [Exophiala sideris]KAK5185222.1 hypothetical protein LTR44_002210 [Eurotiomycetes sp. CCFEE 6388]